VRLREEASECGFTSLAWSEESADWGSAECFSELFEVPRAENTTCIFTLKDRK